MTELEQEEFNKLKESCKKSIESIKRYLESKDLTLNEIDCLDEGLRELLAIWEY